MRIRKYDFDYGRRALMDKVAKGIGTAGVLAPLWPLIAEGSDTAKAYPDELVHIEALTKGKIKTGDMVTEANVEFVKDLLDPIAYMQIKTMGRKVRIIDPVRDASMLFPNDYLMATLRNKGKAGFDATGNVVDKTTGGPWIGGLPFAEPKSGIECCADLTLSWGRHDYSQYAIRDTDLNPEGDEAYHYEFVWDELNTTARSDGRIFEGHKDLLRFQSVWFTSPQDTAGSSFLSIWHYDQRQFPELYGYLPAFKRVRQFPTNQRFEPLVPGITLFLSDAWAAGDPMLTWGNYRIISRGPHLQGVHGNWWGGRNENWEPNVHGGPKGRTFYDTNMELIPECIVFEAEPTGYPRAPVSKKRIWLDVRNGMIVSYVTYDRNGQIWKSIDPTFGQYIDGNKTNFDGKYPSWSWTFVHIHDIQAGRMSRFHQAKHVSGDYRSHYSSDGQDVYNKYLTVQAISRLGSA